MLSGTPRTVSGNIFGFLVIVSAFPEAVSSSLVTVGSFATIGSFATVFSIAALATFGSWVTVSGK